MIPEAVATNYALGERISHIKFGTGVVLHAPQDGYLRAFFGASLDRLVRFLSAAVADRQ
jgi:hypothetical protein